VRPRIIFAVGRLRHASRRHPAIWRVCSRRACACSGTRVPPSRQDLSSITVAHPSRVTQVTEFRNASRYPLSISSAKTLFRLGPIAPGRFTMTTMLALIALWIALSVKLVNDACDRGDRRQDLSRS